MKTAPWAAAMLLAGAVLAATTPVAAEDAPRAVDMARTTAVPTCTHFVDAAAPNEGTGTALAPYKAIGAAIEGASPGAVICVAEGAYAEQLAPGAKHFTLAGGFQRGSSFKVRDSAVYVSKAVGTGGSFIRIEDPGPTGDQLTAIDGFEITGYSQAIVRDYWESQRFDLTNNYIHDNVCAGPALAGAGFALVNVSGTIKGNVFANNSCARGGAGFLNDTLNQNAVSIEQNLIDGNAGTEEDSAHGPGIIESADPRFAGASMGDFRLGEGSPAAGKAGDGTDLGTYGGAGEAFAATGSHAAEFGAPPPKSDAVEPDVAEPRPAIDPGAKQDRAGQRMRMAVARGDVYMGFPERFNRYYTDPSWKPSHTLYVSPDGGGDGATREAPMAVADAVAAARPGIEIYFLRGAYTGCFEFTKENGGTYDEPVMLYAERNDDGSVGVSVTCCGEKRKTCFNLEAADYIAIDGFELIGGSYGVRAVGAGFPASEHSRGIAVLNCDGHDQERDPFFSGQSDWAVWEGNVAYGAKEGDGHGIYLSNGSDWNIVRSNETFGNLSSDFQINADPTSTCAEVGIAFTDPRCDAYAGEGEGGQGASDYFLVDGNYFHDSLGPGPNFTSVRRSIVRNNIFGPQARHNVSFWQETDNPKLASSDNKILHNLFITRERHAVQFANGSTRNEFANNLLLGISQDGAQTAANPKALLMEVDGTVGDNVYRENVYVSGRLEGREFNDQEWALTEFSTGWFANFPLAFGRDPNAFAPATEAPFLGLGEHSPDAPLDRNGAMRRDQVTPGPIEGP